jgi:hypothetical protein
MKKIILTLSALAIVVIVVAQELTTNSRANSKLSFTEATFNWSATVFDFGQVKKDVPVTHEFTFINTGDVPLIISSVQASCGCTVTEYSKDPIAPGNEGHVKATYNAAKVGQFSKTVTVNANTTDGVVQLTIKGEVAE